MTGLDPLSQPNLQKDFHNSIPSHHYSCYMAVYVPNVQGSLAFKVQHAGPAQNESCPDTVFPAFAPAQVSATPAKVPAVHLTMMASNLLAMDIY